MLVSKDAFGYEVVFDARKVLYVKKLKGHIEVMFTVAEEAPLALHLEEWDKVTKALHTISDIEYSKGNCNCNCNNKSNTGFNHYTGMAGY